MSFLWKPCIALHRKRLAIALAALPLCALLTACGNDDTNAGDMSKSSSAANAADNGTNPVLSANPSSVSPALAAVTIQSPALPAPNADVALSAAAPTPLATPVIHTVD